MSTPPKSPTPHKSPATSQGGLAGAPGEGRLFAALAYILPLLGGIIGILADGGNPFTRAHAQQSIATVLTLVLSFFVWAVCGYLIALIPLIGPIITISLFSLVIALAAFLVINWLLNFWWALRGETRVIPLANRVALRLFGELDTARKSA